jgi:uncharacterized membrane protein
LTASGSAAGTRHGRLRPALAALFLIVYAVLVHASIAGGRAPLAPIAWICLAASLHAAIPGRWGLAGPALMVATLLFADAQTLLKFPPVAFNLALAAWFGRSLLPGEEPVIGWFARVERGAELPQDLAGYARGMTVIWTLFFIAMVFSALALALFADPGAWSVFTNGVDYLLVGVLFVGEYVYRRLRYPGHDHASLAHHIRAVFAAIRLMPRRSVRK